MTLYKRQSGKKQFNKLQSKLLLEHELETDYQFDLSVLRSYDLSYEEMVQRQLEKENNEPVNLTLVIDAFNKMLDKNYDTIHGEHEVKLLIDRLTWKAKGR